MQLLIRAASGYFWQIAQIQVSGNIFGWIWPNFSIDAVHTGYSQLIVMKQV